MRYLFSLRYVGTPFSGFQDQPGKITVQSTLEAALKKLTGEDVRVTPSGRTDAGVHALKQFCHVDFKTEQAQKRAQDKKFLHRFNQVLKPKIAITSWKKSRLHARLDATEKTYEYILFIGTDPDPFFEERCWRRPFSLNTAEMKKASLSLLGKHDFSAFCASDSNAKDHVRHLYKIKFSTRSPAPFLSQRGACFLRIRFTGKGFLKQMVRNLVGTLVDIGEGRLPPEQISKILKSQDRRKAGQTAPAHGLYLVDVQYAKNRSETRSLSSTK